MSDIDTPSLNLASIDLSIYSKRDGLLEILRETERVLRVRGELSNEAERVLTEYREDVEDTEEEDLAEVGLEAVLAASEHLADAGLTGYKEDGFFYIESI